ncbi:MAG TPA: glycosyltransferase [Chloroflexota bacterium]|nr:glycosyltransferase [Chloroflexota bacterium]
MYCSVVIPARNAAQTIAECVLSALSQSAPRESYEVVVVDDGSTDATAAIARSHGVRVIPQPPLGMAAARNTGARVARGEVVLFLDADCVPALDWVAQMVAPFRDASVAGVKGTYLTHQTGLLPRLIQVEYEDKYRRLAEDSAIDFVDGYSTGYRRSVLLGVGGFDPSLGAAEEVDLSYRLATSGQRLVFAPKARVHHNHGGTVRRYVARKLRFGLWRSLVYARHPGKAQGDRTTTRELRLQIPLAGLTVASVVLGSRWRKAWPLAGLFGAAFASTTVPFAWRARRAGTDAALASPALLFVRALALGTGLAIGGTSLAGQSLIQRVARLGRAFRH